MPGTSYLFTYPFWIFVDKESPPNIREINAEDYLLRLYPPFRSGPANFIPSPDVNLHTIPFIPGKKPQMDLGVKQVSSLAIFPTLVKGRGGNAGVHTAWGPDWAKLEAEMRESPMDSLRIDIVGSSAIDENVADQAVRNAGSDLIRVLRWRSRQWWIGRSVDALVGYLRIRFAALSDGTPIEKIESAPKYGSVSRARGDELAITAALWDSAVQDLRVQTTVPLHALLLLDAIYFEAISDLTRSVLDCAAACELVKDTAYSRKGWPKSGYDLPEHIGNNLERFLSGHSYERDHPSHFAIVRNLWDARGNITHSAQAQYRVAGQVVKVDSTRTKEFITSAEHCIAWLNTL